MKIKRPAIYIPTALIIIILALIPFHAFLTVWGSSLVGHYTALRLWKECLLAVIILFASYLFFADKKVRQLFYYSRLIQLILIFLVIELVWGLVARSSGDVNTKALLYGWLSDSRYFVFFIVVLILAKKTSLLKNKAARLLLYPAVIVIAFGILEVFVLPKGFLSHFGYGSTTIEPYQTINSNDRYARIISTLRGADPLGAYLIVPLSMATVLIVRGRKVWQMLLFTLAGLIVMYFSFSRSAWLGVIVAMAFAIFFGLKSAQLRRNLAYIILALIIIFAAVFITERNNTRFQNIVFHTQKNSAIKSTSDQGHSVALRSGLKALATQPLGKGPGTSGPASVYNNHPARIPENYYVQIGEEVGWLGLAVYIVINVLVFMSLWVRRKDALSLALLASFIGIFICNMLLESWTDDTLSYLWWGLAAIAIAYNPKGHKSEYNRLVI